MRSSSVALLLALGLLLSPALDAAQSPAFAIFGGANVADHDTIARSLVAVRYQDSLGTHLCTGALIAARLVLTAGHCTAGDRSQMRVIFSPQLRLITSDRVRFVAAVARPPASPDKIPAFRQPDDLAVLLLAEAAPDDAVTVALPDALPKLGAVGIAGYGATSDLKRADAEGNRQIGFDRKLRTATMPLKPGGPGLLVGDQTEGAGTCTGDSGGPAFVAAPGGKTLLVVGTLIGVSSPKASGDFCRGTAYFTSVAQWKPWIITAATAFGQKL